MTTDCSRQKLAWSSLILESHQQAEMSQSLLSLYSSSDFCLFQFLWKFLHPKLHLALCIRSAFPPENITEPQINRTLFSGYQKPILIESGLKSLKTHPGLLRCDCTLCSITNSCTKTYIHSTSTLQISSGGELLENQLSKLTCWPSQTCRLS